MFSEDMIGDPWRVAPGPIKARFIAAALKDANLPVRFVPPEPASRDDLYQAHDRSFVDDVLECRRVSAFGTLSEAFARALPYSNGAVYSSALLAFEHGVSASLTSGFHHAHFDRARAFCTFNGLVVACMRLFKEQRVARIAILDCDYHYGDGTDALLRHHGLEKRVLHVSFGRDFRRREQAEAYLRGVRELDSLVGSFDPELILYQAGVDVHVDDPLGGLLTTSEIETRDRLVFSYARDSGTPIAWNLAGGYQVELDGTYPKIVALHLNTFTAAASVFLPNQTEQAAGCE